MPALLDQFAVFVRDFSSARKIGDFHPFRFSQGNTSFDHGKNGFTIAMGHMHVDWLMVIAVKEKPKSFNGENCGHCRRYFTNGERARSLATTPGIFSRT